MQLLHKCKKRYIFAGKSSAMGAKRGHIVLLAAVVMMMAVPLCAQQKWKLNNVIDKHYFSLSASGGYYSLLENIPEITTKGGGGCTIGIGYEFRYSYFWLSAGFDFQYGASTLTTAPFDIHREFLDTQGKPVNFHFYVDEYSDTQHDFRIGIPVMVGFCTNGIYGGIGMKFSYAPRTVATPSIKYVTTGTYEQYIDDFENMPNHFYTEYTAPGRTEIVMKPQGHVIAELGYDILNRERMTTYALCSVLKVAAYAEYGINSCMSGSEDDGILYGYDETNPAQLIANSYYAQHNVSKARIVPLFVGIKVTFMLRIKTANCRCDSKW